MAISEVSKITIFSHSTASEFVIKVLHDLECVEVIEPKERKSDEFLRRRLSEISSDLEKIKHIISTIFKYSDSRFHETKYKITPDEEQQVVSKLDWRSIYKKVNYYLAEIAKLEIRKSTLINTIQQLQPWSSVNIPFKMYADTKRLKFIAGQIAINLWERFKQEVKTIPLILEKVNEDKGFVYFLLVYPSSFFQHIKKIRTSYAFTEVLYPTKYTSATPLRILRRFQQEVSGIEKRIAHYQQEIGFCSVKLPELKVFYDYLLKTKNILETRGLLLNTKYNTYFHGWIVTERIKILEEKLKQKKLPYYILVSAPSPGEDVPVVLKNNPLVEPFEVVTDLYGKPNYQELDPTPFLSPFFVLFFGICMADVGYGLAITLAGFWGLKVVRSVAARRFLKLVLYCGISTLILGALTGSYFGNLLNRFEFFSFARRFRESFLIFDPLQNPLMFLGVCLLLGLIQTIFGCVLKSVQTIKNKNWQTLFLLDIPTLGIQTSFPLLLLAFMFNVQLLPIQVLLLVLGISAFLIMLNQWLINDSVVLKLFQMFFVVYGVITGNALSDPLSYSRLFALGLSTALLAMALNEIASLIFNIGYLGILPGIIFLIVVHGITLAISALGAYVHTSRLQYLEFFNKFFQGGGRELRPLKWEKKYTI